MNKIYFQIRDLRKKSKITQKQMSDRLGVHQSGYSLLEKGGDITVSKLSQIARILKVPITYFFDPNIHYSINTYIDKRNEIDDVYTSILDVQKDNSTLYNLPNIPFEISNSSHEKIELQSKVIESNTQIIRYQEKEILKCISIIKMMNESVVAKKKFSRTLAKEIKDLLESDVSILKTI